MVKHGKRYNNILEKIDISKLYNLEDSVALTKSTASFSFGIIAPIDGSSGITFMENQFQPEGRFIVCVVCKGLP